MMPVAVGQPVGQGWALFWALCGLYKAEAPIKCGKPGREKEKGEIEEKKRKGC